VFLVDASVQLVQGVGEDCTGQRVPSFALIQADLDQPFFVKARYLRAETLSRANVGI
jgi:hypothetical protein